MDSQDNPYADAIEHEYQLLEKRQRRSWALTEWLLGRGPSQLWLAGFRAYNVSFLVLMAALTAGAINQGWLFSGDNLGWEAVFFAVAVVTLYSFLRGPWAIVFSLAVGLLGMAWDGPVAHRDQMDRLTRLMENDPRLQGIVEGMIAANKTPHLSVVQADLVFETLAQIELLRAEGLQHARALKKWDERFGTLRAARARKRGHVLSTLLPTAIDTLRKYRF